MSQSLHDVQARFAQAPLFDAALAAQLEQYQRRAHHGDHHQPAQSFAAGGSHGHKAYPGQHHHPQQYPHAGGRSASNAASGHGFEAASPFRAVSQALPGPTPQSQLRGASRTPTVGGASVWGNHLPPEIQRPAAVQWLLQYAGSAGPGRGQEPSAGQVQPKPSDKQQAAKASRDAAGLVQTPRDSRRQRSDASPSTGGGNMTPRTRRRIGAAGQVDPAYSALERVHLRTAGATGYHSSDAEDDASPDRRASRARDRQHINSQHAGASATDAALSTEAARSANDDPHNTVGSRPSTLPPRRERNSGPPSDDGVPLSGSHQQSKSGGGGYNQTPLALDPLESEEWAWRKLERADDNINRALARRGIQQMRLRDIGMKPPGTTVDGGVQTEAPPDDRSKAATRMDVSHPRVADEAAAAMLRSQDIAARADGGIGTTAQYTPGKGHRQHRALMLEPMGQQAHVTPQSVAAASGMSVQHYGGSPDARDPPSRDEAAGVSKAGGNREWSLAWARSPDGQLERPTTDAGRAAASVADVRADVTSRIDQLQLGHEERVISHGLVGDDEARRDPTAAAARAHVAEANRRGADVPAPAGGYGSIAEGTHVPSNDEDAQRWRDAKRRREALGHGAAGTASMRTAGGNAGDGGGGAAIDARSMRQWASEHATAMHKRAGKSEMPQGPAPRDAYSARRKWGNVSFAVPANAVDADPNVRDARNRLELDYRVSHMLNDEDREARGHSGSRHGGPSEFDPMSPPHNADPAAAGPTALPAGFSQPSYGFLAGRDEGSLDKTHREARAMFPGEAMSGSANQMARGHL